MPRPLFERCEPDSIREFRAAADVRYADGQVLVAANQRAAAIYLWGYAAEMVLKAAYFSAIGYRIGQPISRQFLEHARRHAQAVHGIFWPGGLHNIQAWSQLLVNERARLGKAYAVVFASRVTGHARTIYGYWRETLRYHKNRAYPFEANRVRSSLHWLITNRPAL